MDITPRETDFATWYQDVVAAGDLAEHSGVKGSMVIKPHGYALWELMRDRLDAEIKATGHKNAYFPLLIPESYLKKEQTHVKGFAPELALVTYAGGEELTEPLVIRPTSETIIYATYARWIQSWRDLPLLINQWANVVRWELRPRLFLRTTEFLWQEGHTAHATEEEAEAETRRMLAMYERFARDELAMPVLSGQKTDREKFAGAVRTYSVEALMQDGKALQAGTSHNLGQNFAKVFDVAFADQEGKRQYVWQTSWGVSTRLIGALIMSHGDDKGLVLPPRVAPIQAVIVPIWKTDEERRAVFAAADRLAKALETQARLEVDRRDHLTPGAKYNDWEKKGVPIRIDLGPREVAAGTVVLVRRDTGEKSAVANQGAARAIGQLLVDIQTHLLTGAEKRLKTNTHTPKDYADFEERIGQGGFFRAFWCGAAACEEQIASDTKATIRVIPFDQPQHLEDCLKCGQDGKFQVILARAY